MTTSRGREWDIGDGLRVIWPCHAPGRASSSFASEAGGGG